MLSYSEYLETKEWKIISDLCKRRANYRCQLCNSKDRLEAHHRTYDNIGNSELDDLVCLCHDCHANYHKPKDLKRDKETVIDCLRLRRIMGVYMHFSNHEGGAFASNECRLQLEEMMVDILMDLTEAK